MEEEYEQYVETNSADPYRTRVVSYSKDWADLMEARLVDGSTVSECADATSHEADTDGIPGFMYGCAVQGLSHFWEHGEELRLWHNLDTQINTEGEAANESGGVLNPAVLNIG